MYSIIAQLKQLLSNYKEFKKEMNQYQIDATVMRMKILLNQLSMDYCSSDHQRYSLQCVLDEIGQATGTLLLDSISEVRGKMYSDCRDKFIKFCWNHNVKGNIDSYCRGIDFRHPTECCEVDNSLELYQWCCWTPDNDIKDGGMALFVGQWFTDKEVDPDELGVAPGFDLMLRPEFKRYQGTSAAKALCKFKFISSTDCFKSVASGMFDDWSIKLNFDRTKLNPDGCSSQRGFWGAGGSTQFFVPIEEKYRVLTIDNNGQCVYKNHPYQMVGFVRQWGG